MVKQMESKRGKILELCKLGTNSDEERYKLIFEVLSLIHVLVTNKPQKHNIFYCYCQSYVTKSDATNNYSSI